MVDALVETWRAVGETGVEQTKVIGHRWSAPSYQARDLLARNAMLARKLGDGTNLIDNAADAMHGEGTHTVRTAREGEFALVEIGDTGDGVPPEAAKRIFEPFFTTKPVSQGTGLGLDVSWRVVVNRHHGDLQLQSQPGDTRFQVRLPLQDRD